MEYPELVANSFRWDDWERLIAHQGVTIDRPYRSTHPEFPNIIYPLPYGYVNGTTSSDGQEVDVFVGSAESGLVGLILTKDYRRRDREMKLLYHCSPKDVYMAHGFINFDRRLMAGTLVLRYPMQDLWRTVKTAQVPVSAVADRRGPPYL